MRDARRTSNASWAARLSIILLTERRFVPSIVVTQVEIIKGVSLSSLAESAPTRTANIWQAGHQRTQILVLLQRRHRQRFESHSSTVGIKHPCWAIFYRPRKEANEIEERGLDPKSASFMFLDVALEDLGRWVGPLVKDEWPKEDVIIAPSEDADEFTPTKWTTFRDPWLDSIEVLPLHFSPYDIEAKAWLTIPSSNEMVQPTTTPTATPQEDSDFVGKLAGLTHSFGNDELPKETAKPEPVATPETESPAFVMPSGPVSIPNFGADTVVAELEPAPDKEESSIEPAGTEPVAATYLSPQPVEVPEIAKKEDVVEDTSSEIQTEEIEPQEDVEIDESIEIKEELVDIIQLLKAGGLEAENIMESPAFQEVSERATAAGLDVWNIFVSNVE